MEFRPGNRKIVHHAIFFLDTSGEARKRETVPGQGYSCVGGPGLDITGSLGGWAPGAQPSVARDGVAHTIKKGSDLVMQIHYHLDGKPEQDQSSLGLTFSKTPPTKGLTLFVLGNEKIDIPAGDAHYVVKASGVLPMDAEAIAIFPHAHYLCKDMKVDAHLPDGIGHAADLDQGLGFQLAGRVSLRESGEIAEGHAAGNAVHLRQLRRESAQSQQSSARGEVRRADHQRNGDSRSSL